MPGLSLRRTLIAATGVVLGLTLLAAGLAELFIAERGEAVTNLVRPELSDEGLAQHRADFETASRTLTAVQDDILPAVAAELGLPDAVVLAGLALQFPDVARVLEEQDEMTALAEASLLNLERQQANFESADSLPASWLPWWAGAALALALSSVVVAAVLHLLFRPRGWAIGAAAIAAAGLILIAVPLALRIPWKSADAVTVLDSLNPSEAVARQSEEYVDLTRAGLAEFEDELLPAAAAILAISEEELDAEIAARYPTFAADLAQMPAVLDRYDARAQIRSESVDDILFFKDLPLALLSWFGPVFGLVLLGFGAIAWWNRAPAESPPTPSAGD